ncbi:cytochrome P450 [Diaminobutyricibacter sp. McL0608]|uniref:cytochrome P450 n=1 Tax=Leifsonia sp. McL0608 TaxID=3143537 RepID=UPI0031F32800
MQHTTGPDSTLGFLRDGYLFGQRRFRPGDDAFATRLVGRRVVVMKGAGAARFFYEDGRFDRIRSMPVSVSHLLQDEGSVQSLEGAAHARRKALFLGILDDDGNTRLVEAFASELERAVGGLTAAEEISLFELFTGVLTTTACRWVGLPDSVSQELTKTGALATMVERAGTFGPANWAARVQRNGVERLLQRTVRAARTDPATARPGSPLAAMAGYLEGDDGLPSTLSEQDAAVELLNLLRPVVAVGRFMVFAALALHTHPRWRDAFTSGEERMLRPFTQEVRRFYPFFPVIAGRATGSHEWRGHSFHTGDWVMLDLYATTHDPALWGDSQHFRPERFVEGGVIDMNALIPQGGGHYGTGHRCPGEPVTVDLVNEAVRYLTQSMEYGVPEQQDLRISLRRFPTLPRSGFRVEGLTL